MDIYSILKNIILKKERLLKDAYICIDENEIVAYNYYDLYNLINKYIDIFKNVDLKNKAKYLIVDNSIESLAIFVALLQCKAIPVLIDKRNIDKSRRVYDEYDDSINYFNLISHYPYDYIMVNNSDDFLYKEVELQEVKKYIDTININLNNMKHDEGDFYMCTSGTTGTPKLVKMNELKLIKRIINDYSDTEGYSCYCYNSISSIMGLTFNLLPILLDNKLYFYINEHLHKFFEHMFEDISNFNINHFMLPRNFIDYLPNVQSDLNLNCLKKIYLAGEVNDYSIIDKIRTKYDIPENVFVNLYGSTEMYGGICKCEEKAMNKIYIYFFSLLENEMIYTYDKKNIYILKIENGKQIKRKIDMKYLDDLFVSFIPVSNYSVDNIFFKNNGLYVVDELLYGDLETGDLGFYIDNNLYVIGRKNDVVNIKNKKYLLPAMDIFFGNVVGLKSSITKIKNLDILLLVVNYDLDWYSFDNFKSAIPLVNKCEKIIKEIGLPILGPLFIASDFIPKSKSLRKTLRRKLEDYYQNLIFFNYAVNNYDDSLVYMVRKYLYEIIKSDSNISYKNGYIYIYKDKNINIKSIVELLKYIGYHELKEDSESFSFRIDDSVLFGCLPKWNQMHFSGGTIESIKKYMTDANFIERLNKRLLRNNNIDSIKIVARYKLGNQYINLKLTKMYCVTINNDFQLLFDTSKDDNKSYEMEEIVLMDWAQNVWYTKEEFNEKMKLYQKYFNHEYVISRDLKDVYIDGIPNDELRKDTVILEIMNNINRSYASVDYKIINDFQNDKNVVIINNESNLRIFRNLPRVDVLRNFSVNGYIDVKTAYKKIELEFESIAEYIARFNAHLLCIDNPILIVNSINCMRFSGNCELQEALNTDKLRQLNLFIEKLKRHHSTKIFVDNKEYIFDFSKLKIVYLINDDELYNNPTLKNLKALGYPKCLYNGDIEILKLDNSIRKVKR